MNKLLSICDIQDNVLEILELANKFKKGEMPLKPLEGKSLAMIFQKSSTRTRVSFEVGMYELGGTSLFLSQSDLQMGRGEPINDTAKVLSRYVNGIMIRANNHGEVEELARAAEVPVISGLTNLEHPCQALADAQTIKEHLGGFKNKKLCFMGDGNNVCNSLLLISACLGMDMFVACPEGYEPNEEIIKKALDVSKNTGSEIVITHDSKIAANNADVVYTDVWVSMGDEVEEAKRKKDLSKYQVNSELMKLANENAIFMHCLPAIRGEEVTSDVIDGNQSVIFDEAENRLHAQKAVLYYFLK
ncbi:ornithine carbamoyltransferase [Methanobrevibacter sp. OttesenSCG-928-K11]|nr:ornithine carbamoyltransferase [Methanobrevibacter sp. OttesenSCG-928-K11]MDL2270952.1 ornithine carbamoyltransferase [Methanobrevibacter sp. OttesenSCG-928-I08]